MSDGRYTVEIITPTGWKVLDWTSQRAVALALFNQLCDRDPFGVRLTCEPIYTEKGDTNE